MSATKFEFEQWLAQQVRITAFAATELPPPEQRLWWSQTLGSEPDAQVLRPKVGFAEQVAAYEVGAVDGRLRLSSNPQRVDWLLIPRETSPSARPDTLGSFPEAARALIELALRWFHSTDLPPIKRLAFATTLLHDEDTIAAAYERLAAYIPGVNIDPNNSADLVYQINRPAKSAILEDRGINRLSKWSVTSTSLLNLSSGSTASVSHAVQLDLDINTAADAVSPIAPALLEPLLEELYTSALKLAQEGDAQ